MPPVIVIGAGIVGVCAAAWLQRAGRQVLLIDQGDRVTDVLVGGDVML